MIKMFYEKIDLRSRKTIIVFLKTHFRYNTMNSWNQSTSYAHNVKLHTIPCIPDNAYEMLQVSEAFDGCENIMNNFAKKYDYVYQISGNGRNGGYLVLIRGGYNTHRYFSKFTSDSPDDDEDYSDRTGWKTHVEAKEMGIAYSSYKQIFTQPGKDIDMGEDFKDWDMNSLKNRAELIMEFDKACDEIVADFIDFCKHYSVEEEIIMVPKKIMIAKEIPTLPIKKEVR